MQSPPPSFEAEYEACPILATVEVDRYCEGCGYNLYSLPVRRESRTGVLMTRCTECGRFNVANQAAAAFSPWLNRLAGLLLVGWILMVLWLLVLAGLAEGAIAHAVMDSRTRYDSGSRARVVRPEVPPADRQYLILALATECTLGFLVVALLTVACHHWRRWVYAAVGLCHALIVGCIALLVLGDHSPQLLDWGVGQVGQMLGAAALGCGLGALWGRSVARVLVGAFLPPRPRQFMSFLWLADHLQPPACPPIIRNGRSS